MTTFTPATTQGDVVGRLQLEGSRASVRAYFLSDRTRAGQTLLALIWLLDGGLQFQSFMYSRGFVQMITALTPGQPTWVGDSVRWGANTAGGNLTLFNTLFALTQVVIGLGILYRPTARPALALSIVWALFVWWFGEAFGMMFMSMAAPLTGAPGAVLIYALIALIVWPSARPGGLLGAQGARIAWCALWVLMAYLWLQQPSSGADAITNAINAAPSGMSWLSSVQNWAANAATGDGLPIALVMAAVSLLIGIGVAARWRARELLQLSIVVSLAFWVFGEGFGGIFQGGATDPNSGLPLVLLAYVMFGLVSRPDATPEAEPRDADAAVATD
ncbi:MAG: hypothetical protein FWD04_02585 [Conexibacteraceae bacterium]|nr:hypothetical protein [Conexibacteraceae bacterium]